MIRTRQLLFAPAVSLLLLCCGAHPPVPYTDAQREMEALTASGQISPDAKSVLELQRLLKSVKEASKNGDAPQTEQYIALIALQIQIVRAEITQNALLAQLETVQAENARLNQELETVSATIRETEIALERRRIRAHVTAVVEESRRKAAAEEAYRARFKGEKVTAARIAVGSELLARATVLLPTVSAYEKRGLLDRSDADALRSSAALADEALNAGDLFQVQMLGERIAATAREGLADAWPAASGTTLAGKTDALCTSLAKRGLESFHDPTGCWISLLGAVPGQPKVVTEEIVRAVAELYLESPMFHLTFFSTVADKKSRAKALAQSETIAAAWADAAQQLGVAETDISAVGCAAAAPFYRKGDPASNTVLFLVPIPKAP